jgi:hypothetical protein
MPIVSWISVKAFFHHPVIKTSYLVVVGLPIVLELMEAAHVLPRVSTSIYEIFYSGILMLVSRLIYGLAAPTEVKDYDTYHQYVEKHQENLLNYNPEKRVNVVLVHLDETEGAQRRQIEMLHGTLTQETDLTLKQSLKAQLSTIVDPIYPTCVIRYLQKEWGKANESKNKMAMWICFLLNLAASILAIVVFIHRLTLVITHNFLS